MCLLRVNKFIVTVVMSVAALSGCIVDPPCSPSTCPTGCCDAKGVCQAGSTVDACGSSGQACTTCNLGQSCRFGFGASGSGNGGQGGGTQSSGGGTASGGGTPNGGGSNGGGSNGGGTSGGGTNGGGSNGGGSNGGGSGQVCDLQPITGSVTFNRDLKVYTVAGTITVNNAAMPNSPNLSSRGEVGFKNVASGDTVWVTLTETGPGSFSTPLFGGTYDVYLKTTDSTQLVGLPMGSTVRVATNLAVTGNLSGVSFNVSVVTLNGTITVNGAQMPGSSNLSTRGRITVSDASGTSTSTDLGPTGVGSFSMRVFAGTYDVSFQTTDSTQLVGLPQGSGIRLQSGLALAGNITQSWNVEVVTLTGNITVNGAAMPSSPNVSSRGTVTFSNAANGSSTRETLTATGAGSLSLLLFKGTYDVTLTTANTTALNGLPSGASTRLQQGLALTGNVTQSWNVSVFTLNGAITVNGGQMPDSPDLATRGSVTLRNQFGRQVEELTEIGPGTFSTLVFSGSYDLQFNTTDSIAIVGLPQGLGTVLQKGLTVNGNVTQSWNVTTATVNGTVTVNGAVMPDSPNLATRGSLVLTNTASGTSTTVDLDATGPAQLSVLVFTGTYNAALSTTSSTALVGLPIGSTGSLQKGLTVNGNITQTWDAKVVTAQGTITINGAQMPGSPNLSTRGSLLLRNKLTGSTTSEDLTEVGPGSWSALIFAGTYDIVFETVSSSGLVGMPPAASPSLAVGCVDASSCTASATDFSGTWQVIFDNGNFGTWSLNLVEASGQFSGDYTGTRFSGAVLGGTHNGSDVRVKVHSSGCDIQLTASAANACLFTGRAECLGFSQFSNFVGVR